MKLLSLLTLLVLIPPAGELGAAIKEKPVDYQSEGMKKGILIEPPLSPALR